MRAHASVYDAAEQIGGDGAIGEWSDRLARLDQTGISLLIERLTSFAGLANPLRKSVVRHRIDRKSHVGKAITAEHGG